MYVEVPQVSRCCFCFPLRKGIIAFASFHMIASISLLVCSLVLEGVLTVTASAVSRLNLMGSTTMYSVLGLGIILDIILLIGSHQSDLRILRLYNFYATALVVAALIPSGILLYQHQIPELFAALVTIFMQLYVIIMVRSKILILEHKEILHEIQVYNIVEPRELVGNLDTST